MIDDTTSSPSRRRYVFTPEQRRIGGLNSGYRLGRNSAGIHNGDTYRRDYPEDFRPW